jgi:putative membrane protein
MHQQALDMIDKNLEPAAQNDELKQLLKDSRPAFAAHLEHAKRLQAQLQKAGTAGNTGGGGGSR